VKIRWTRLAVQDLNYAAEFIAADNPSAAESIITRIEQALDTLAKHPEIGRPGRIKTTRELVVTSTPFIIPYRIKGAEIHLLAVLHGKRKWPESL